MNRVFWAPSAAHQEEALSTLPPGVVLARSAAILGPAHPAFDAFDAVTTAQGVIIAGWDFSLTCK